MKRKLKPDAIPTIFKRPVMQLPSRSYGSDDASPSGLNRKRSSTTSSVSLASDFVSKKRRTAFEKRERARVSINSTNEQLLY